MPRHPALLLFFPVLSAVTLASEGQVPAAPAETGAPEAAPERGVPALFAWGDIEGDGRLDLAAVSVDGTLRLLASAGDGRFEDVTERVGLAGVENAALALWADYDADGRLDLFVGAREGASRLFRNQDGIFLDMTAGSGFTLEGAVHSAQWLDHDGDGRLDLFAITAQGSALFRGIEGGFFERSELPFGGAALPWGAGSPGPIPGTAVDGPPDAGKEAAAATRARELGSPGSRVTLGTTPSSGGAISYLANLSCANTIKDLGPGSCLQASSTPTLGRLYPLSANLFVAVGGNVGIGTTTPAARLDVAGTARMTGTLTLAPGVDQALDVSTGSIYKGGALFIHTKGGSRNTAVGRAALASVSSGSDNTASGDRALYSNTYGSRNSASGAMALYSNTGGYGNSAAGAFALSNNTTGSNNTASGRFALGFNTTGEYNTANGSSALISNTTGNNNTASGTLALFSNTTGDFNTANGSSALFSNTTGNDNTASGLLALFFNTTGNQNTAGGVSALYSNTTGSYNTATGHEALRFNTTGVRNTASGASALRSNTTGIRNTASGYGALRSNTTGSFNVADGEGTLRLNTTGYANTAGGLSALYANTTGTHNTATGYEALRFNTTGSNNTACGNAALRSNTTGARNTALGRAAGSNLTTGSDNIAIGNSGVAGEGGTIRIGTAGTQTRAFLAGVRGVTTGIADAIPVLVDSAGQLGTVSSSRRFKEEIRDMGDATERLLELRPVTFRYKPEVQSGERPIEYGLIAEEVAEVFPDLVVYDEEGQPFTVKYHLLSSMLLNELKQQARELEEQRVVLEGQQNELARLRGLEARLGEVEARVAPVATQAEAR